MASSQLAFGQSMRLHTDLPRRRPVRRRRRLLLAMFLAVTAAGRGTAGAQPAAPEADNALWGQVGLPGGAAAAREVAAIGSADGRLDGMVLLDVARRHANSQGGAVVARLDAHLRVSTGASEPDTLLPLPLPSFWRTRVFSRQRDGTAALVSSRRNLLLYHGLMALDDRTLEALAARPGLVDWLLRTPTANGAFATAARSIRIDDDAVQVPGGESARGVWTSLTRRAPSDIDRFLRTLLTTDDGRLAWFYDAVAGLPEAQQRFVLGAQLSSADRNAFVRAVYRRFASIDPGWRIEHRPFHRPPFDGTIALMALDVRPDGTAGPDWWPSVFARLTSLRAWPAEADLTARGLPAAAADARWFFDWVFSEPDVARQRFETLRFAQRLFLDAPRDAAPHVEIALRGVMEMPALLFTLERMGVRDPALLALLARTARMATDAGNLAAIGRWQAALALLEQAHRHAPLPPDRLAELLRSWTTAAPTGRATAGSLAQWVADVLVPAVAEGVQPEADVEEAVLDGATGIRRPAPSFEWEGLAYENSPSSAARHSAAAIRAARPGIRIDDLLALRSGWAELDAVSEAAGDPRPAAARLHSAVRTLTAPHRAGALDARQLDRLDAALVRVRTSTLNDARRRVADLRPDLLDVADAVVDVAVRSLVYALAVSPTSEPMLYPDLAARHQLRDPAPAPDAPSRPWQQVAWQRPVSGAGSSGLVGSYLGVDVELGASQLLRVFSNVTPVPQVIDPADRAALVEALVSPGEWTETAALRDIDRLAAGRRRVSEWKQRPPERGALAGDLARAGIDAWRANTMAWTVHAVGPAALDLLSIGELFALGADDSDPRAAALWSGSSRPVDGCLCRMPGRIAAPERLRGQHVGVQAFGPLDGPLRVAELVHQLGVDLAIVPALLPMAMQDWIDRSQPAWTSDVDAFRTWPLLLDAARVDEYLMALLATGRLVAPDASGEDSQ